MKRTILGPILDLVIITVIIVAVVLIIQPINDY